MISFLLWLTLSIVVASLQLLVTTVTVCLIIGGSFWIVLLRWLIVAGKLVSHRSFVALFADRAKRAEISRASSYSGYLALLATLPQSNSPPRAPPPAEVALLTSLKEARQAGPEALQRVVHRACLSNLWSLSANTPLRLELCSALSSLGANRRGRSADDALGGDEAFFATLTNAAGRTALCLSGGGALALSHLGVVAILLENGALPAFVHGVSGGSVVAAIVCCASDANLASILNSPEQLLGEKPLHELLKLPPGLSALPLPDAPALLFPPLSSQLKH